LLREHPGAPNADRFLDLANRGVRRIESTLKELRDLQNRMAAPPPVPERLLTPERHDDPGR
jgi:hypothetical protein